MMLCKDGRWWVGLLLLFGTAVVPARDIDLVVIHATGGPGCKAGRLWHSGGGTLASNQRHFARTPGISYHYLIGRDGTTVAGTPVAQVAHHARGHNAHSIGIELVNDGDGRDPFPEPQIQALIVLLRPLLVTYDLSPAQVRGHGELDTRSFVCGGRRYKSKVDPGGAYPGFSGNFPWRRLREALAR
ncbi:N-acetylmuramoyl-L-alanine amidase [Marichromatium bheemlicum]|uniref:N-acetylmuramoyl-L-alanine amidase n=1 Tax=Marichromatium bheemlicum TaxID=365339 RepID=A0ABX1IAQ6_9GAMM|nr:peptidoglycan recognition family protein [Marichromatium bheemlicum]NKN34353.1 N-acetylmuramoyl-L-alanine amidase [Marichromatium bheemlicum]